MTEQDFIQRATSKKSWYYDKAFQKASSKPWISWNWSAALFGHLWMIYHKMYKEFFLYMLTRIVTGLAFFYFQYNTSTDFLTHILERVKGWGDLFFGFVEIFWIVMFGLFSNKFFLFSLKRKYKKGYGLLPKYKSIDRVSWKLLVAAPWAGLGLGGIGLLLGSPVFLLFCCFVVYVCLFAFFAWMIVVGICDFVRARKALSGQKPL